MRNVIGVFFSIFCLLSASSVLAEDAVDAFDDVLEAEKLKESAVKAIVDAHDTTLILRGGELMVRQQVVKAAKKFV
ncbi:MAG: hypothetical protein HN781_03815, partial [Betaproteobacteria bacterium]|nr:hypothetical protein [Betaproteobacteria bacterium]